MGCHVPEPLGSPDELCSYQPPEKECLQEGGRTSQISPGVELEAEYHLDLGVSGTPSGESASNGCMPPIPLIGEFP